MSALGFYVSAAILVIAAFASGPRAIDGAGLYVVVGLALVAFVAAWTRVPRARHRARS